MPTWNPWHGCHKLSSGCQNCYVYRIDQKHNRDSSVVVKNQDFNLPIKRNKKGEYKIPEGETVYTCFSSDFFVEEADEWRKEAWNIIKQRMDLDFLIITKRIDRFWISLPDDWENGYENVSIYVTCENQDRADYRLPIFQKLPIKRKASCPAGSLSFNGRWLYSLRKQGIINYNYTQQKERISFHDRITSVGDQILRFRPDYRRLYRKY